MKNLVETTGEFQLVENETQIRHVGYTVVSTTPFIQSRISLGQVHVVAEVSDEATDAAWLDTVKQCDGDLEFALDSFKAEFPSDGTKAEKPTKGKAPAGKKSAE